MRNFFFCRKQSPIMHAYKNIETSFPNKYILLVPTCAQTWFRKGESDGEFIVRLRCLFFGFWQTNTQLCLECMHIRYVWWHRKGFAFYKILQDNQIIAKGCTQRNAFDAYMALTRLCLNKVRLPQKDKRLQPNFSCVGIIKYCTFTTQTMLKSKPKQCGREQQHGFKDIRQTWSDKHSSVSVQIRYHTTYALLSVNNSTREVKGESILWFAWTMNEESLFSENHISHHSS